MDPDQLIRTLGMTPHPEGGHYVETWLWHAGSPLRLGIEGRTITLGPDVTRGQSPQAVVPKDAWQAAESLGGWTLVSCIVAPGFSFEGFELAPAGWSPAGR
jgi:uncharacterized protein